MRMQSNCDQGPYISWLPACMDADASMWARVLAGLLLCAALVAFARLRPDAEPCIGMSSKLRRDALWQDMRFQLAPALCGIVVFAALLAALFASGFFKGPTPDLAFLSRQIPALGAINAAPATSVNGAAETVARGIWATTFGAIVVSSLAVCWVAVSIWRNSHRLDLYKPTLAFAGAALLLVVVLWQLGKSGDLTAFGSKVSNEMLCGTWKRGDLSHLGPLTDGLNAVAVGVSMIVAGSFCLLMRAIHTLLTSMPHQLSPSSLADSPNPDESVSQWPELVRNARRIQDLMDYVLYVGAAALMAGLLEVVATLSWSYAPYAGSSELKVLADLCKALQPPVSASAPAWSIAAPPTLCIDAASRLPSAETVDELRRFTRSLAIVFGASFSALLAAMYLPVAMAQQRLVHLIGQRRPSQTSGAGTEGQLSEHVEQLDHDLERSMVQRVFNVLATLGPLAIAIVSTVFGI